MSEVLTYEDEMSVELIKHNCSDEDVARAAWVSNYGEDARTKDAGRINGLINFLVKNKHWSPVEHNSLTVFVEVPIFVAREVVRHRTFSYNEWSGRYSELLPKFYVPGPYRPLTQIGKVGEYKFEPGTSEQYDILVEEFDLSYKTTWNSYKRMLDAGIAREVARDVLPLGIFTKFYMTGNLRSWLQFFALRSDETALQEIQWMSKKIENIVAEVAPITYDAWKTHKE